MPLAKTVDIDTSLREWAGLLDVSEGRTSQAEALYFDHILDWVIETATGNPRNAPALQQRCDLLISLMGYSPETTVIATALLRPKALAVVSNSGVDSFERACQYLVNRCGYLKKEDIREYRISPTNYSEIRDVIRAEKQSMPAGGQAVVDVTGGKKIMAAIAGQAASQLGIPLCYVESQTYQPATRRSVPGSEVLLLFPPPTLQRPDCTDGAFELSCYYNQNYLV